MKKKKETMLFRFLSLPLSLVDGEKEGREKKNEKSSTTKTKGKKKKQSLVSFFSLAPSCEFLFSFFLRHRYGARLCLSARHRALVVAVQAKTIDCRNVSASKFFFLCALNFSKALNQEKKKKNNSSLFQKTRIFPPWIGICLVTTSTEQLMTTRSVRAKQQKTTTVARPRNFFF